ncbi:hypothetical protein BH10PAT3_BH10PAT3_7050 [soil metagenome]
MGSFSHNPIGRISGLPNKKVLIASTALLIVVPVGTAISINMHHQTAKAASSISVQSATSSNPASTVLVDASSEQPAATTGSSTNTSTNHTTMTVNGETIEVPENGTTNQTIESAGGTVNVQASGSGQATNNNNVSTDINIQSSNSGTSSNSWSSTNVWVNQNH